jgi:hypothetical protein
MFIFGLMRLRYVPLPCNLRRSLPWSKAVILDPETISRNANLYQLLCADILSRR